MAARNETESSFTGHYLNFGSWKSLKANDEKDVFSTGDSDGMENTMTLDKDFENTSGSVFMYVDQKRLNATDGKIYVEDEQSAFALMDGNYANKLDIIVLNESLKLDSKELLAVQRVTASKKSVRAHVYKIINWSTVEHKAC